MDLQPLFTIHQNTLQNVPRGHKRYLYDQISWKSQALCLSGARGVGKTTLLHQHYLQTFGSVEKCLYLSADHVQVVSMGLFAIAQEYFKYGGEALIIDEVHRYPLWSQEVKNIFDTYKSKQIFLSGSSSIALGKGMADLSRRVVRYSLKGLSFREYLEFALGRSIPCFSLSDILQHHVDHAQRLSKNFPILKHFRDYLSFGYYPYFLEGREVYFNKLLNVIDKILSEDIPNIFNVSQAKIPILKKMIWLIASSQPFIPNIERMSQTLNLSKEYTYHFLEYLQKAELIQFASTSGKGHRMIRKPGKIFLENTNLWEAINGSLKQGGEIGTLRETFFLNQMKDFKITLSETTDFLVEGKYHFEVGGKGKGYRASKEVPKNFYQAIDNIEIGTGSRIPLYLFGFLY